MKRRQNWVAILILVSFTFGFGFGVGTQAGHLRVRDTRSKAFADLPQAGRSIRKNRIKKQRLASATHGHRKRSQMGKSDLSSSILSTLLDPAVGSDQIRLLSPAPGGIVNLRHYEHEPIPLVWTTIPGVSAYEVVVYDHKKRELGRLQAVGNQVLVNLRHDSKYFVQVTAMDERYVASEKKVSSQMSSFEVAKNTSDYMEATDEPALLYSWFRFGLSPSEYKGTNPVLNQRISQSLVTQDIEAAVGNWFTDSSWGILAQGKFSFIETESDERSQLQTYGFFIGHKSALSSRWRMRNWLGLQRRETPQVFFDTLGYSMKNNVNYGIHYLMDHWVALTPRLALKTSVGFHYNLWSSINSFATFEDPTFSYDAGLGLAYRVSTLVRVGASYSYQIQSQNYVDASNRRQENEISGHYINIFVEFGLNRSPEPPLNAQIRD